MSLNKMTEKTKDSNSYTPLQTLNFYCKNYNRLQFYSKYVTIRNKCINSRRLDTSPVEYMCRYCKFYRKKSLHIYTAFTDWLE